MSSAEQQSPTAEPVPTLGTRSTGDARSGAAGERDARLARAFKRIALVSVGFIVIVLAIALALYLVAALWVVVLPIVLGLLLATVLWPPVRALRRRNVPAALASIGVLLGALLLLVGIIAGLAPQVVGQAEELADQVTAGLERLQDGLTGPPLNLGEDQLGATVDNVIGNLQDNAQSIARRVVSGAAAAGSALLTGLLALVLTFFFLKDGPRFLPWLSGIVGERAAPHVTTLAQRWWVTLSGFIKAQAAVGFVDAVFIGIGLALLGVPLALPLAVLVFFGGFIPIVGAVVSGGLAALVALVTNGLTSALLVVALVLLVQQLEGNVLQPILVGRTLALHPAVVILAVTAGGTLAGIIGAFLAVPVVAVLAVGFRYAREQLDGAPPPSDPGEAVDPAPDAEGEPSPA